MTGRPTKYNEEMQTKADAYVESEYLKENDLFPMAAGMALYLKVNKTTLYEWASQHDQFSNTLGEMNAKQEKSLLFKGLSGDYNSTISKLALHNHGYKEKSDITSNDERLPTGVVVIPQKNEDKMETTTETRDSSS